MKGIVFVELLKMAEEAFGEDMVDAVLDSLTLESGGAYTAVGTYPCGELVAIVGGFSATSGLSGDALQRQFGHWMMTRFTELYPDFFADKTDALHMLEAIEDEVHVEVRKLYPDAELPSFATTRGGPGELTMEYSSARPLVPFCHGLIEACLGVFKAEGDVTLRPGGDANRAVFDIRLAG